AKADDPAMTAKMGSKGNGASAPYDGRPPLRRDIAALAAVLVAFLADALDRDHPLALRGIEHDHTLGRAPGDADAFDARADELAPVLDRERRDQLAGFLPGRAVALAHIHGDNAFSAAAGDAVFVG